MVTYNFPPLTASSGIQRSLNFSRFLPENGWSPIVLTPDSRVYDTANNNDAPEIPEQIIHKSSFALNTAKHLSICGKYPAFLALPDKFWTWRLSAVSAGIDLIRKYQPDAIWSTCPIPTTHWIAAALKKTSGIPWIADFRDPLIKDGNNDSFLEHKIKCYIEAKTVANADIVSFTSPSTLKLYQERYPELNQKKWRVIYNGYNEDNFSTAAEIAHNSQQNRPTNGIKTLLHSGILYQNGRNPAALFEAIKELHNTQKISENSFRLVLRATNSDEHYSQEVKRFSISEYVDILPPIKYEKALAEMINADGLLILQGSIFNGQIPAKVFEYFRAQKPILALTDSKGDTARILREGGISKVADMTSKDEISSLILDFVNNNTDQITPSKTSYTKFSRRNQTAELAKILNKLVVN